MEMYVSLYALVIVIFKSGYESDYLNCESTMTSPLPLSPAQISPAWEEAQICTFPSSSIWAKGQAGSRMASNVLKHSFMVRNLNVRLLLEIKPGEITIVTRSERRL